MSAPDQRYLLPLVGVTELLPPARPVATRPPRRPGSVRRSSHVDMSWPEGIPGDPGAVLVLEAAARDVVTSTEGIGRIVGEADLRTTLAPDRLVTGVQADPDPGGLETLVGLRAASGWRAAARQLVPDGLLSPLGLLFDEVPIAVLLSFYAGLRAGRVGGAINAGSMSAHMRDLCAGWATGATPMRSLDVGDGVPLPVLVPVPGDPGDDHRGHEGGELANRGQDEKAPEAVKGAEQAEEVGGLQAGGAEAEGDGGDHHRKPAELQREEELADELAAIGVWRAHRGDHGLRGEDHHVPHLLEEALGGKESPIYGGPDHLLLPTRASVCLRSITSRQGYAIGIRSATDNRRGSAPPPAEGRKYEKCGWN